MNANFGIMPDLGFAHGKKDRKILYCERALKDMESEIKKIND